MRRRALRLLCLGLLAPAIASAAAVERLADVHRAPDPAAALAVADRLAAEPWAQAAGIDFLRGHLLEELERPAQALSAYAAAMQRAPALAPYCRLHLARLQLDEHPEITAGLLVPLLGKGVPPALRHQAAALLVRAVAQGGDCTLLARIEWSGLLGADRRALAVKRAACLRGGDGAQQLALVQRVLAEEDADTPALEAALQLASLPRARLTPDLALLLGRTLLEQRQPELASAFLGPLAAQLPARLRERRHVETLELLGLAEQMRDAVRTAITTFERLARRAEHAEDRARALYEEGVARELVQDRRGALESYVAAANLHAGGALTADALLGACRLQALLGRGGEARRTYAVLRARREWSAPAAQAATFLAVTQLAAGQVGDAPTLLQQATQLRAARTPELLYWTARSEEAQGHTGEAVRHYLGLLRALPYHPLAEQARRRLDGPALGDAVRAARESGRRSRRPAERLAAWLLMPGDDPGRATLRLSLYQVWARDEDLAPYLRLAPVDPAEWPLWSAPLGAPEERALALGDWRDVGMATILELFPLGQPALAFTAAQRLVAAGDLGRGVSLAEQVAAPALAEVPPQLLPLHLRETLFPRFAEEAVENAARRASIEPSLLWAVMREASRYEPHAVTRWGGRGPLLLDPGSAQRAAPVVGLGGRTLDLLDTATAVPLAAARLAQLHASYPGRLATVVAAYVAGAQEAQRWEGWCVSADPAELLTKMPDDTARGMVTRILGARLAYQELQAVRRQPRTP